MHGGNVLQMPPWKQEKRRKLVMIMDRRRKSIGQYRIEKKRTLYVSELGFF